MKNKTLYTFLLGLLTLTACSDKDFSYDMYVPQVSEIDSISFSAGSKSLIADNKASLSFVIETFRKTKLKNNQGREVDTMLFVDYRQLPEGSVKVFANNKEIGIDKFKTSESSVHELSLYAKVGDVQSAIQKVQIRQPQVLPAPKVVELIFHVFELMPTDPGYNPLTYQEFDPKALPQAIEKLNKVFNAQLGDDPNGGNMQIEFKLAEKNASGVKLDHPGYSKQLYNAAIKEVPTRAFYVVDDFKNQKINKLAVFKWDPKRFVNIYVMPFAGSENLKAGAPTYQLHVAGEQPIPGIANVINDVGQVDATDFYVTYGLGVHRGIMMPGVNVGIELSSYLGKYYGLLATDVTSKDGTDYCEDTRKYIGSLKVNGQSQLNQLVRISVDGFKFTSNNAMDDVRYPSLRNSFTLDQVNRVQDVLRRSPVRQAYQTSK